MFALSVIQSVATPIDTTTAVSLGVLVVVLGASWRLSSLLARIEEKLSNALTQLALHAGTPERLKGVEVRLEKAEEEIAALWQISERRHAP